MPRGGARLTPFGEVEATLTMLRSACNHVTANGLPNGITGVAGLRADFRSEINCEVIHGGSIGLRLTYPRR